MIKIKNNWQLALGCAVGIAATIFCLAGAGFALASMFDVYGTSLRFGETPPDLSSGQNLIYGTVGAGSSGNGSFLLFQKPSGADKFRVDHNGNVTATGDVCGNGKCLSTVGGGAINASNVTAGTFGAGDFTFPAKLTVNNQLVVNSSVPDAWGGWYDAIKFTNSAHAALYYPTGGLLFGMHSDRKFYWADTIDGTYSMILDHSGNLSLPTGGLYFSAANPYISAPSYFIAPGGAYFNSGTVYTEAPIQARGGIHNDTAAYLTIAGGTSGATYLSGNVGIGTATPETLLHIVSTSGPPSWELADFDIIGDGSLNGSRIDFRRARGTPSAKSTVLTGDSLGAYAFESYNGSAWGGAGWIEMVAPTNGWGGNMQFWTSPSGSSGSQLRMIIMNNGNVGIGTTNPTSPLYVVGNVSADSFTDRTPYPQDLATAYEAVLSMEKLPEGEYDANNKEKQIDHAKLSPFIKAGDGERDLSATVSAQNEVLKDLLKRIEKLEAKLNATQ